MEAEELMIGDWITYKGEMEQICGVDLEALEFAKENDAKNIKCDYMPIPITPEILEKNGFNNTIADIFRLPDESYDIVLVSMIKNNWVLNINTKMRGSGIANLELNLSYVHELQHALRLCRIEKEIEL